jgi:hypothetical protein
MGALSVRGCVEFAEQTEFIVVVNHPTGGFMMLKIIATIGHCIIGLMLLGFPLADPNFQPKMYQNILMLIFWETILVAIWK